MKHLFFLLCLVGCCAGKMPATTSDDFPSKFQLPFPSNQTPKVPNKKLQNWKSVPTTQAMAKAIQSDKRSRNGVPNKECLTDGNGYAVFVKYASRDPVLGGDGAIFLFDVTGVIIEVQPLVQPSR